MNKERSNKKIEILQVVSSAGKLKSQIATLKGLGLGKIGKRSTLDSTREALGMLKKVMHLVKVI